MKPPLYFAIRVSFHNHVIAVTSVKNHRWYGRVAATDAVTHGRMDELRGRFPTAEAAQSHYNQIVDINNRYDAERKVHTDAISKLYRNERKEISALFID